MPPGRIGRTSNSLRRRRRQGSRQQLLTSLAGLYEDNLFLSSFCEFMALPQRVLEPSSPLPVPDPMQAGIVFDRVSFQYPAEGRQALSEVSLTLRPGQVV